MPARRVVVTGRVQGVFYRAWTCQQAEELGVSGWVRNRADGSVEAFIEGETGGMDALVSRMRNGPDGARVEALQSDDAPPAGLGGFVIRH